MIVRAVAAASLLLALTACGGDPAPGLSPTPSPTTAPVTPLPTIVDPTLVPPTTTPEPTTDSPMPPDVRGFLATMRTLDPALVRDPERAVSRGRSTCQEVSAGKPAGTMAANAAERFSDGGVVLDQARGAAIVAAAQGYLCPGAGPGR